VFRGGGLTGKAWRAANRGCWVPAVPAVHPFAGMTDVGRVVTVLARGMVRDGRGPLLKAMVDDYWRLRSADLCEA